MSLKDFTDAYIIAAMWSSTDDEGTPLDELGANLADDARARMKSDCVDFWASQAETWQGAGLSDNQAGHDFWLTRNRHGAGFWDRGIGQAGQTLTDAAHAYGDADLYVTDTGTIAHG